MNSYLLYGDDIGRIRPSRHTYTAMKIALLGGTGTIGKAFVHEMLEEGRYVDELRLLIQPNSVLDKEVKRELKKEWTPIHLISGDILDDQALKELVTGTDYVLNLAALIPPKSEMYPQAALNVNELGAKKLVKLLESFGKDSPKLIDFSSVAVYGNRTEKHPFGRVGDPVISSVYDIYSLSKIRVEFELMESSIPSWVILRETAVIYHELMARNMTGGLMFHTCFNAPLEWASDRDTAYLLRELIMRDSRHLLDQSFWRKVYNIGGGRANRITGYDTYDYGFRLLGKDTRRIFQPKDNCLRNFHGMWFTDGHVLDDIFHYQRDNAKDFFKEIGRMYPYYRLGGLLTNKLTRKVALSKPLKDSLSPLYWKKHGEKELLIAFFYSEERYDALPPDWAKFPLLSKGQDSQGNPIDYDALRDEGKAHLVDLGFDDKKDDRNITLDDLKKVASRHGGECLAESFTQGDVYSKVQWKDADGQVFTARPYTILRGGHWNNPLYTQNVWDYDRLAKKDKVLADVYYDSHDLDENRVYYFDDQYQPKIK